MGIGKIKDIGDRVVAAKQDHRRDRKADHQKLRGIVFDALEAFDGQIDEGARSKSTKDTAAPTANITAETEEVTIDYYALIEEETAVPPTVADDLNYYEMYQKAKEEEREYIRNYKDGTIPNVYGERGAQYAKEWKSTDGRIS